MGGYGKSFDQSLSVHRKVCVKGDVCAGGYGWLGDSVCGVCRWVCTSVCLRVRIPPACTS